MSYDWLINALRRTRPNRQLMFKAADALEEQRAVEETLVEMMTKEHNGRLALEFRQKWISAEERLPTEDDLVIVAIHDDTGDTAYNYSSFGFFLEVNGSGVWLVDGQRSCHVTHWMPLPKPPKEGT